MKFFSSISIVGLMLFAVGCEQSDPAPVHTDLVWSDEFLGNELDPNKWEVQEGDGSQYGLWLWGNNEDQWYQEENVTVENGVLRIKSVKETVGDFNYTSARIRTKGLADFKYGRFEASIKMANTPGLWHAFWMLPSNATEPWPISGEIDVMEYVGNIDDQILNTCHFADQFGNHQQIGGSTYYQYDNAFHQYAVEWNDSKITWFVDSVETFAVYRSNSQISSTWPFDSEFHLLLNTAVGGNLGGSIDAQAMQTPKYLEVDYVRVYQTHE